MYLHTHELYIYIYIKYIFCKLNIMFRSQYHIIYYLISIILLLPDLKTQLVL